ncbi:MAG TPA: M48 family metalloprotease [Methylophilaceae bacterium]|nr:M48 family metalloprotease [Methylophilaceae bacterium]
MIIRTAPILLAVLLGISSLTALAFDLEGTLKDAIKEKVKTGKEAEPEKKPETKSESEPAFNLKSPSQAEEIQLGRQITGNLLGAAPLVKDAALQKYVNEIGRWVASQSERPDLPWHFGVIESEDINAFAAPGGYVIITKGLYRKLENEAQLAGILGHEISHVVRKHHLRLLQKTQLLNIGAKLLGTKLGKGDDTVQKVIGNGAEILARGLDKDAEYEADRMGVILAARSGYEPFGLPEVLQSISETGNTSRVQLLYKTHPHPDDRLLRLGDAIGDRLDKVQGKTLGERFYKLK